MLDLEAEIGVVVGAIGLANFMAKLHSLHPLVLCPLIFRYFLCEHDLGCLVARFRAQLHCGDATIAMLTLSDGFATLALV